MYVTDALVRIGLTPVYEESDEQVARNGGGVACISYPPVRSLKRYDVEVAICTPDPHLYELLGGGTVLTVATDVVGHAAPATGTVPNANGVSIEAWSRARSTTSPATLPFIWWFLPRAYLAESDKVIEEAPLANVFTGTADENPLNQNGPNNDWTLSAARVRQYQRTATLPAVTAGAIATPAQI